MIKRFLTTTSFLSTLLLASGCGVIPKDGPTGEEVRSGSEVQLTDPSALSYALVKITPTVARHVQRETAKPVLFRGMRAPRACRMSESAPATPSRLRSSKLKPAACSFPGNRGRARAIS